MKRKLEAEAKSVKKPKLTKQQTSQPAKTRGRQKSKSASKTRPESPAPVRPTVILSDRDTLFREALTYLSLQTNPSVLIGREAEQIALTKTLLGPNTQGRRYVLVHVDMCGMPGTGKTATFMYILSKLQDAMTAGELPAFTFININCMKLTRPQDIYQILSERILNQRLSDSRTVTELNKHFKNKSNTQLFVVLVDEIDALITKKQDVLYHIFDWPCQPHSGLIVTGISNTMDLAERFLTKVSSRLGKNRIVFAPYKKAELEQLVSERLKQTSVFSQEAVSFAASKIAGFSGDARRALQTCRQAAQICLQTDSPQVEIQHIQQAHQELYSFSFVKAIPHLPYLSKLTLLRLALKSKMKSTLSVALGEMMEDIQSLGVNVLGPVMPTRCEVQELLAVLGALGLIAVDGQVYKMMVSIDEVCQGLQKEERLKGFLALF